MTRGVEIRKFRLSDLDRIRRGSDGACGRIRIRALCRAHSMILGQRRRRLRYRLLGHVRRVIARRLRKIRIRIHCNEKRERRLEQ